MRRALVLTDETARHPFRASLPHRLSGERVVAVPRRRGWRFTAQDLREFLMAYCACFLAVSAFIS